MGNCIALRQRRTPLIRCVVAGRRGAGGAGAARLRVPPRLCPHRRLARPLTCTLHGAARAAADIHSSLQHPPTSGTALRQHTPASTPQGTRPTRDPATALRHSAAPRQLLPKRRKVPERRALREVWEGLGSHVDGGVATERAVAGQDVVQFHAHPVHACLRPVRRAVVRPFGFFRDDGCLQLAHALLVGVAEVLLQHPLLLA
mmetsp:Transcript_55841/g.131484  ORF Transcript_55841/g.131484 Transcript_55841/m.131484 type:complete len:202 (+) Transcript_55841:509-1114(+)